MSNFVLNNKKELKIMKYILNLFIENNDKSFLFLRFLRANSYNGTVFSTASLKHTLEDTTDDDKIFINLHHLDPKSSRNNLLFLYCWRR